MQLEIKEKKENALLSRLEVVGELFYSGPTPSKSEIKKVIADKLKVDENLVVVKYIYPYFGLRGAKVEAFWYYNKKALQSMEKVREKKKEKIKASEKAEESKEVKEGKTNGAGE